MKKLLITFAVILTGLFSLSAQVLNDSQIIKTDHWIYSSMEKLFQEQRKTVFNDNSMMSVSELKFIFKQIDYETLSPAGKTNYENVKEFLFTERNLIEPVNKLFKSSVIDDSAFRFDMNIKLNPELYYKSNPDIDWTFDYYFKDNIATAPLRLGFSNIVAIENDLFVGKSHLAASRSDSFTNLPYKLSDDFEFLFNKFAYGSVGYAFDKWGFNVHIGKQGLEIGNTQMESVYYSDKFETDGYFLLNLYTNSVKYSMNIAQVDSSKFLYLHQLELIAFQKVKFAIMEGSQVVGPMELRFLNPFLFMHQMSSWNDYMDDTKKRPYGEENFCAYFGWLFETSLVKNTRIYALYSQNEITPITEQKGVGRFYPDSIALQVGFETSIPSEYDGYWNFGLEAAYTSPFMYIKHTPQASLYRSRQDNLSDDYVKTWIGSPFGPDTIAVQGTFGFEKTNKWKANIGYLIAFKGENDFIMFNKVKDYNSLTDYDDGSYYYYYPSVAYKLGEDSEDNLLKIARNLLPSGIVQITNRITLNGEYTLNKHLDFGAQAVYSFVFNNKHNKDVFEQGIELSFSMTYNLF